MTLVAAVACGKVDGPADAPKDSGPDGKCDPGPSSGLVTTKIRVTSIDKIDLLFVVDNSSSMADKQLQLARAIPAIVKSLTNPDLDPKTGSPRVRPIADLHLGVLSTSLGSHGTSACAVAASPHNDDHGHLLPRAGEGGGAGFVTDAEGGTPRPVACPAPVTSSALSWVFDEKADPTTRFTGIAASTDLQAAASCIVQSVQEDGCGYEETWESLYHFLVDPQPWLTADVSCTMGAGGEFCGTNKIEVRGVDDEVLKERKAFLRPDSLLSIVVVSDENDASLKPAQLNWLPWSYGAGKMMHGWKACDAVPDDFEPETGSEYGDLHGKYGCFSCFENTADPGGNCTAPWGALDHDDRSLRAFEQTKRFGYNFLWSRQRYVDAFKNGTVPGLSASGAPLGLPNPIFAGGFRTPDQVVVTGIVGVPVGLVSDAATGKPKTLTEADWSKLVSPDLSLRDPHMIESIGARKGLPKFAGDRSIDPVSGGERDHASADDLQYACIGKRTVSTPTGDCSGPASGSTNPLCDSSGNQPYFKAYPGLRHLRILHDLGASGVVGSICSESFAPIVASLTEKLHTALGSVCFRSVLSPDPETSRVDCTIVESFANDAVETATSCEAIGPGYCTPGAAPCRVTGTHFAPLPPALAAASIALPITVMTSGGPVQERVNAFVEGTNIYAMGSDGVKHLLCEELQLTAPSIDGATAAGCLHDPGFSLPDGRGGFCYTQDPLVVGDTCIAAGAPGTIRYLGNVRPRTGSEIFTTCLASGAPLPPTCE